jgi:hypothetical protein
MKKNKKKTLDYRNYLHHPKVEKRVKEIQDNVILDGINDGKTSVELASFMKIMFDKQLENEKAGKPMPDILKKLFSNEDNKES